MQKLARSLMVTIIKLGRMLSVVTAGPGTAVYLTAGTLSSTAVLQQALKQKLTSEQKGEAGNKGVPCHSSYKKKEGNFSS